MRYFMKINNIILIIFALFISCQNQQEKKVFIKNDSVLISTIDTVKQIKPQILYFDTLLFKKSFDSLISLIMGTKIKSSLQIDTTNNMEDFKFYPFVDSSLFTIKYRFRSPKPNGLLSITIYESFFKDSIIAGRQFKISKFAGSKEGFKNHGVPGLSYANDFVIKYKDKIVALNAPCPYADKSYRRLLTIFKNSFKIKIPADTIKCNCGWFCE